MPSPAARPKQSPAQRPKQRSAKRPARSREGSREVLNMRVLPEVRSLIDHAAKLTGKNRTDFVLDAARSAAQEALLAETQIQVSPRAFAAFMAMLDAPAHSNTKPNARLRKALQTPPIWE